MKTCNNDKLHTRSKFGYYLLNITVPGFLIYTMFNINAAENKKKEIEQDIKENSSAIISVSDGQIANSYIDYAKEIREGVKYYVSYQDNKNFVIYLYLDDPSEREKYSNYLESKVYVTEDGKVLFDEKSISEVDYNNYIAELELDQTNGTQRTRNKKEN